MKTTRVIKSLWLIWALTMYALNVFDVISFETMVGTILLAIVNVAYYNKGADEK